MKKLIITLLIFAGIALAMVVTCPDSEAHKNAFKEAANEAVQQELNSASNSNDFTAALGGLIGNYFVDNLVDSRMSVKNYFVCSIGYLNQLNGSEPQMVTIGLFNHIFAPTAEQIRESIDK